MIFYTPSNPVLPVLLKRFLNPETGAKLTSEIDRKSVIMAPSLLSVLARICMEHGDEPGVTAAATPVPTVCGAPLFVNTLLPKPL